jgi:hypothetical protein
MDMQPQDPGAPIGPDSDEADLASLRARISQFEQDRETEKKQWAKLGLVSLWIAIGFMVYGIALGSIDVLHGHTPGPMAWAPIYVIAPLAILIRILRGERARVELGFGADKRD